MPRAANSISTGCSNRIGPTPSAATERPAAIIAVAAAPMTINVLAKLASLSATKSPPNAGPAGAKNPTNNAPIRLTATA